MAYSTPYLFIVSARRSGSTALQALLNSDPKVLIRGENNNFFYETFRANRALQKENTSDDRSNPWFGFNHFKSERHRNTIRRLGKSFLLGNQKKNSIKVLGFKEIRMFNLFDSQGQGDEIRNLNWQFRTPERELFEYLRYLKTLFPNAKIIFLRRDPSEIVHSGWWKDQTRWDPETLSNDLDRFQTACTKLAPSIDAICINYKWLRNRNMKKLDRLLYGPLDLPFSQERCALALQTELTHSQWNHLS